MEIEGSILRTLALRPSGKCYAEALHHPRRSKDVRQYVFLSILVPLPE